MNRFWLMTPLVVGLLWNVAKGQAEEIPSPELLIVARETKLHQAEGGKLSAVGSLPPRAILRTLLWDPPAGVSVPIEYRYVVTVGITPERQGWVIQRDCHHFYTGPKERLPWTPAGLIPGEDRFREIPALIKKEPEHIQQVWKDLHVAIEEARRLVKEKKLKDELPEPYFARAQIWASVKNHDAALQDYLRAASLVKNSGRDMVAYAKYFLVIHQALDNLDRDPRPPTPNAGQDYYAKGYHAFWSGDLDLALKYFDDAIQVESTNPLYWYYRALTYKRQGNERRARHDVLIGAHLEGINRKYGTGAKELTLRGLERVQGPFRQWLSAARKGELKADDSDGNR